MQKTTVKCYTNKPPKLFKNHQRCKNSVKQFEDQQCLQCGKYFEGFFARVDHQCLPHVCGKCHHSFATDSEVMIHEMHCMDQAETTKLHSKKLSSVVDSDKMSSTPSYLPKNSNKTTSACESLTNVNLPLINSLSKKSKDTKISKKGAEIERKNLKTNSSNLQKTSKKIVARPNAPEKLSAGDDSNPILLKKTSSKHNRAGEFSKNNSDIDTDDNTSTCLQSALERRNAQMISDTRCMGNEFSLRELSSTSSPKKSEEAGSTLLKLSDQKIISKKSKTFSSNINIRDKMAKYKKHNASELEKVKNKTVTSKSDLISEQSTKAIDTVNRKSGSKVSDGCSENFLSATGKRTSNLATATNKQLNARKRTFENSGKFNEAERHHMVRKKILLLNTKSKELERTIIAKSNYTKSNASKNSTLFCNENDHRTLEPHSKFEDVVNSLPHHFAMLLKAPAEEFKCAKCWQIFKNLKKASTHYINCKSVIKNILSIQKDVIWVCTICHKSIVSASKISQHAKSCQNSSEHTQLLSNFCQFCGETFVSLYLFERHPCIQKSLSSCHVLLNKISIGASSYNCDFCSAEFTTELELRTHSNNCSFQISNPEQDFASQEQGRIHIKEENVSPESSPSIASVPFYEDASAHHQHINSNEVFFHTNIEQHIGPEMVCISSNNYSSSFDACRDSSQSSISFDGTARGSELSETPLQRSSCLSSCSGTNDSATGEANASSSRLNCSENVENVLEMLFSTSDVCTCQQKTSDQEESKPCLLCLNDVNKVRNVCRKISKNPGAILNLPGPSRLLNRKKAPKRYSTLEQSSASSETIMTAAQKTPQISSKGGTGYPTPPVSPHSSIITNTKNIHGSNVANTKNAIDLIVTNSKNSCDSIVTNTDTPHESVLPSESLNDTTEPNQENSPFNIIDDVTEGVLIDLFGVTGTIGYDHYICAKCCEFKTQDHSDIVKHLLEKHKKHGTLNVVQIPKVDDDDDGPHDDYLKALGIEF